MTSPATTPLNIVVAGGGVAGLEALLALRGLGGDRIASTLLTPEPDFLVRPWTVQEPFALPEAHRYPLARVAADVGAELRAATLASVDPAARTVTTGDGETLAYDALVVTLGASQESAFEHVTTFRGRQDSESVHGLLQDIEGGYVRRLAFVVPAGIAWPLPLYELALMTAERARSMSLTEVEIALITPEAGPLAVFGPAGSEAVGALLADAGITLHTTTIADVPDAGTVALGTGGETLAVDRVIALPRLSGRPVPGLPTVGDGFLPIDDTCAVTGVDRVWAAGDGTSFPLKQGGIAAQQADTAANAIAALAGAPGIAPEPFKPVLRGMLLTGSGPKWLRAAVAEGEAGSVVSEHALWWPPSKIAGRYLAPYLTSIDAGLDVPAPQAGGGDLHVDVPLHAEGDPAGGIERLG